MAGVVLIGTGLALVTCLVPLWRRGTLRGRRGTWRHLPSFHVAGVALGDIHLRFAWQVWYLWDWAGSGDALGPAVTSTAVLRGNRGSYGTGLALVTRLVPLWRRGTLRGRRGAGDIYLRFTWQAWHLVTSTVVLRDRRGTYGAGLALVTRLFPLWRRATLRNKSIPVGGPWLKTIGGSLFFSASRHGRKTYPVSYLYLYDI